VGLQWILIIGDCWHEDNIIIIVVTRKATVLGWRRYERQTQLKCSCCLVATRPWVEPLITLIESQTKGVRLSIKMTVGSTPVWVAVTPPLCSWLLLFGKKFCLFCVDLCTVYVWLTVADEVNTQLTSHNAGRLFAVVHVAGKQRKLTEEDIIIVDKHIVADIGQRIRLNKVRYLHTSDQLHCLLIRAKKNQQELHIVVY